MLSLAVLLSLAVSASGEPADGPAPSTTGAEGPATAEVDASAPGAQPPQERLDLRGWRQDLAVGLDSTTFWSHTHHHYTFHSLGLGYLASWGRRGLFVHATGLFPVQGREDGRVVALGQYYRSRWGGDALTGFQWRWRALRDAEAQAGIGPHASFLVLRGITGYRNFSASPLGVGAEGSLRWRTGRSAARWPLTLALFGSAAVDFWDPIHGGDLRHGFTFRAGVALGLAPGGVR